MSAITDALRRASAAQNEGAAPPPLPLEAPAGAVPPILNAVAVPPLLIPTTIDDTPEDGVPSKKSFSPILVVVFVLFVAAGAAGFYLWKRHQHATQTDQLAQLSKAAKVEPAKSVAAKTAASVTSETKQPAVAPAANAAAQTEPVAPKLPPPPRIPVSFPSLRLQGIYYKPSNPSVVINGRTLYLNDEIQGVSVAAIDTSSVTLVLSGQTNVLTLR